MNQFSNEKLYKLTLYTGVVKTILTLIVGIVTVPYTLNYFGTEKYGVWSVITSLVVFLSMTNLGLNSATSILINKNSNYFSKILILKRSFIILLFVIPIIFILLFLFNHFYTNWIGFINSPKLIENEAKISTIVTILFTLINIPFSLIVSALNGFHKNYVENIFGIGNIVLAAGCLVFVVEFKKDLIYYAYASNLAVLFLNIIRLIYFNFYVNKHNYFDSNLAGSNEKDTSYSNIIGTGYRCLMGAIASMFVLNTDNIVIAKFIGINYVTQFSVTFKIYTTAFSIIYLFNSSIVPLIGRNINNKEYIKKIYNNTLFAISIFGGLIWVGTVSFGKELINLWVGDDGYAGVFVLIFLGAYSYIFSIVNLNYILINSLNLLNRIVYVTWLEGILNLVFSILLGMKFGLIGIAAGTFLGTFLSPFFLFSYILRKRTENLILQDDNYIVKHFLISLLPTIFLGYLINMSQSIIIITITKTALLCILYLILSYICLPPEYKIFVQNTFRKKKFLIYDIFKSNESS